MKCICVYIFLYIYTCIYINTGLTFDNILSRSQQTRKAASVYTKPAAWKGWCSGISRFASLHLQSFVPLLRLSPFVFYFRKSSMRSNGGGSGSSRCDSTRSSRSERNGLVLPHTEFSGRQAWSVAEVQSWWMWLCRVRLTHQNINFEECMILHIRLEKLYSELFKRWEAGSSFTSFTLRTNPTTRGCCNKNRQCVNVDAAMKKVTMSAWMLQ